MAGKKRISVPGGLHYIYAKSIDEMQLFRDKADQIVFLNFLDKGLCSTNFKCLRWEFSQYEYKLLIKIDLLPLSALFQGLNSRYALYYNKRYSRHGHLFDKRYRSAFLEDSYENEIVNHFSSNPNPSHNSPEDDFANEIPNNQNEKCTGNSFEGMLKKINDDSKNKYDPKCWCIGSKEHIAQVMEAFQKENHVVADYTLTDWSLENLKDYILEKTGVLFHDFIRRGRLNTQSKSRKLFCFYAVINLGYKVAEVGKFLKVSGTAVSKLARAGIMLPEEMNIELLVKPIMELTPQIM